MAQQRHNKAQQGTTRYNKAQQAQQGTTIGAARAIFFRHDCHKAHIYIINRALSCLSLCVCVSVKKIWEKIPGLSVTSRTLTEKRYLVCLSPHLWKDTWSVCHLKNYGALSPHLWKDITWSVCHLKNYGALHPVLCFKNSDSGMLRSPPTPHISFFTQKRYGGKWRAE